MLLWVAPSHKTFRFELNTLNLALGGISVLHKTKYPIGSGGCAPQLQRSTTVISISPPSQKILDPPLGPMWSIKPTISGDYITIVGFEQGRGRYTAHYQIPVEEVISSLDQPLSTGAVPRQWEMLSAATYWGTTTVPYSNPPVIIGGKSHSDEGGIPTSDISLYDSSNDLWEKVDSLTTARIATGVSLINNNTIIIIGGSTRGGSVKVGMASCLTTVEIGNIVPNQ